MRSPKPCYSDRSASDSLPAESSQGRGVKAFLRLFTKNTATEKSRLPYSVEATGTTHKAAQSSGMLTHPRARVPQQNNSSSADSKMVQAGSKLTSTTVHPRNCMFCLVDVAQGIDQGEQNRSTTSHETKVLSRVLDDRRVTSSTKRPAELNESEPGRHNIPVANKHQGDPGHGHRNAKRHRSARSESRSIISEINEGQRQSSMHSINCFNSSCISPAALSIHKALPLPPLPASDEDSPTDDPVSTSPGAELSFNHNSSSESMSIDQNDVNGESSTPRRCAMEPTTFSDLSGTVTSDDNLPDRNILGCPGDFTHPQGSLSRDSPRNQATDSENDCMRRGYQNGKEATAAIQTSWQTVGPLETTFEAWSASSSTDTSPGSTNTPFYSNESSNMNIPHEADSKSSSDCLLIITKIYPVLRLNSSSTEPVSMPSWVTITVKLESSAEKGSSLVTRTGVPFAPMTCLQISDPDATLTFRITSYEQSTEHHSDLSTYTSLQNLEGRRCIAEFGSGRSSVEIQIGIDSGEDPSSPQAKLSVHYIRIASPDGLRGQHMRTIAVYKRLLEDPYGPPRNLLHSIMELLAWSSNRSLLRLLVGSDIAIIIGVLKACLRDLNIERKSAAYDHALGFLKDICGHECTLDMVIQPAAHLESMLPSGITSLGSNDPEITPRNSAEMQRPNERGIALRTTDSWCSDSGVDPIATPIAAKYMSGSLCNFH
ncbi:hypothetical protein WOLCODRAFT_145114 [Wolfiporia cocos MD-104 SS10]|uniref:Uncharacterized protein n=1 Tax=Wolfiporia cocos (strain MD-104) TaxID=742152 RepID=A0A2H3JT11_WOLCO|nr:hypothetical protein WOLCODRAFT_145114 [Wolfiporia cocos MD-104 SS10]